METIELKLDYEIVGSYKRLSYKLWYAIAEFVDNSTQAYFNYKEILDKLFQVNNDSLTVFIVYGNDDDGEFIKIIDNSIGMSQEELQRSVTIGKPPEVTTGRSRYGLGMKTAACWMGDYWEVCSKKLGENTECTVLFDVNEVASGNKDLPILKKDAKQDEHYTIITIKKLHKRLHPRSAGKTKDFLRSMYRRDFESYDFKLFWQGERLTWVGFDNRLLKNKDGGLVKRPFEFTINNKKVFGWAGVFETGSRADAGFSLIQANRVIKGWPDAYRPSKLFGYQEGGINDLVNQRLVGEIILDEFDVSQTKDEIIYNDDEEEILDNLLFEEFADFKKKASEYRKSTADERQPTDIQNEIAIKEFHDELASSEFIDIVKETSLPPEELIKETNKKIREQIEEKQKPTINIKIDAVEVKLYIVEDMSPYDPYVIIEATANKDQVIVIVNKSHPHWIQLNGAEGILNYLRHCTYDGVAEWKAYNRTGKIDPDTVKLIKDGLLRLPFEIEKHQST